jgi:hypothetical protein
MGRYGRGQNSCEHLEPLNDKARYTETSQGGPSEGYEVKARRPRVAVVDEMLDPERAASIEGVMRDYPSDY